MFNKTKKSAIFIVTAVLLVVTVMLTACNVNDFKPEVELPAAGQTPQGNGGNAVVYGKWLYYVNGYQSSASAENTYTNVQARVGAIARIELDVLERLFDVIADKENYSTSAARTKEIARLVAENAEMVVPKFYYSGNTTSTHINGIYIYEDRLYILTPNDELTAGGNSQTSQSVLTSFKLDGSDQQRHYTFSSNSAQILLCEGEHKLLALYISDSDVGCIDASNGQEIAKIEETSGATIDVADQSVFYIDSETNAICKLHAGDEQSKVIVDNDKDSNITYTISNVNGGYVYYTKSYSINSGINTLQVYYAVEGQTEKDTVALKTSAPSSNWYGYKDGIVKEFSYDSDENVTLYGIKILDADSQLVKTVVEPINNDKSVTFNRIEGDKLYYTCDNVAYVVDLSSNDGPQAIGRSLASASGWSVPDIVYTDKGYNYVISLSSGAVGAIKFNVATKTNSESVTITIVEPTEEE